MTNRIAPPWEDPAKVAEALQQVELLTGNPAIFLDYEFNRSAEPVLNLVCCSLISSRPLKLGTSTWPAYKPMEIWLHNSDRMKQILKELHLDLHPDTVFYAYAAVAEGRSTMALDLDPHRFLWIDLYAEWRQLTFNNNSCAYGTYFTATGYQRYSVPPHFNPNRNKGKDNKEVGLGLTACVGQMFGVYIDSVYKTKMRDLIISDPVEFTAEEQKQITEYCTTDIMPLPFIFLEQHKRLIKATKMSDVQAIAAAYYRGRYMVSGAKMESVGFPLDVEATTNLRRNFAQAREEIIVDLVENYFPFYVRKAKPGQKSVGLIGDWQEKYDQFELFLDTKYPHLKKKWPRTIDKNTKKPTKTLARDEKTLEKYDGVPEIYALRQAKKNIGQLRWFKAPDLKKQKKEGDFFDNVGSDGRLRSFLGLYGTQTGRNAPKASRFILAMSNWLRCLIKPPAGYTIIAMDYASQEFAIAAVMSQDKDMIAAYRSGDPYLYFAKKAGAVPAGAEPKKCKTPSIVLLDTAKLIDPDLDLDHFFGHGCPEEISNKIKQDYPEEWANYEKHLGYENKRNLFKATTLGLQYGMGAEKLADKLTADMGTIIITEADAQGLIKLHKKTYPTYWAWLETITKKYERNGCLILKDFWALLGDNSNSLSVRNLPVQGTGSVIMREAVHLLHQHKIDILSPLHDALYTITKNENVDQVEKIQAECMLQAVANIIGVELEIRLDIDKHTSTDTWVEFKGRKFYKLLGKYLDKRETPEDRVNKLYNTIFKKKV